MVKRKKGKKPKKYGFDNEILDNYKYPSKHSLDVCYINIITGKLLPLNIRIIK